MKYITPKKNVYIPKTQNINMAHADRDLDDFEHIAKKTEQTLRIFGTLWDKRLSKLERYFKERYGFRFLVWQGKRGTAEEVANAFSKLSEELRSINSREQKVLDIIKNNLDIAINRLESAHSESKQIRERVTSEIRHDAPGLVALEEDGEYIINLIKRYRELSKRQYEILELERNLLEQQSEQAWRLYLIRMESFVAEIRQITSHYEHVRSRKRKNIEDLQKAIVELRNNTLRKPATAYLGPSVISAIVRVFGANILSLGVLGSMGKVGFWEFTSLTTVFVAGINFTDYYWGWATRLSNRMARTLRLAK
jgi:hypothetical protein